jgi:hypothetical protein
MEKYKNNIENFYSQFFESYGLKTEFYGQKRINLKEFFGLYRLKNTQERKELKNEILEYFSYINIVKFDKINTYISYSTKKEKEDLEQIFSCVNIIYNKKRKIGYYFDEDKYEEVAFPLISNNRDILKLKSKESKLKILFAAEEKLYELAILEILEITKICIQNTDFKEKLETFFVENIFELFEQYERTDVEKL